MEKEYGTKQHYKTLFYPEVYQQKLATSAGPCSGKQYPSTTGEFSSRFYLMIEMMELRKDLVLKTPLPTACQEIADLQEIQGVR